MSKILIIEDEEVLLEVLESKLKKVGYEVVSAKDGEEGYAKIKSEKPDLILLDIIMPKMGGFEVMRAVSKEKELAEIPIIVISNSGQPVEIEEATSLGAKDFLIKAEFDPEEVIEKVKKQLKEAPEAAKTSSPPPPQQQPEAPASRGQAKADMAVLIVEDDKFLRDLIVQKLAKEGFKVIEAIDGEEGMRKLKEQPADLVLLDLILPGIDGFEVLRRMREDPKMSSVPVIILSNLGQKEDVERGLKLGAQDYLIKAHFTPGEIIDKVKNTIQESSQ